MAKQDTDEQASASSGQGRAVMLTAIKDGPNKSFKAGDKIARQDFCRDRFYKDGILRGDIRKEMIEYFEHDRAYQIVFSATKEGEMGKADTDPRIRAAERKEEKAAAKAKADAEKAASDKKNDEAA